MLKMEFKEAMVHLFQTLLILTLIYLDSVFLVLAKTNKRDWKGFKIVGDNLDKNFRCTFQRIDYQTRSFHFFHTYAVLDRVNLSGLSDIPQPGVIDFTKVLPTHAEVTELKQNLSMLVTRYVMYIDFSL